jgi:glutamate/tyrosine decarboxylase-like PLP-dependent enzyme
MWRSSFGDYNIANGFEDYGEISRILETLALKFEGNYPFHHPQYAGQMLKPPHPVAWLAYTLAMTINPNNHALDGGPPTSEMEKECIDLIAEMVGYKDQYLGHLTSGGTIANLEALFVARETHPGKSIAATSSAHYTHSRMCRVLNCDFLEIPTNEYGVPDLDFIEDHASKIGTLVVTLGTTGLGIVEPLSEINDLADNHGFRIHADAAYGGFFSLISEVLPSKKHWTLLSECDSIVIDPHKHGLQPYGCGSVLYKSAAVGTYFKHDSPYTYFTSDALHLGEISLECSRAGAAAAALWATLQLLPLTADGLGKILLKTRNAAIRFSEKIHENNQWQLCLKPELDITGYFKVPAIYKLSELNRVNHSVFEAGMRNKKNGYHVSLFKIPANQFIKLFPEYEVDATNAVILRSVFMKDEHYSFVDQLADRLFSFSQE